MRLPPSDYRVKFGVGPFRLSLNVSKYRYFPRTDQTKDENHGSIQRANMHHPGRTAVLPLRNPADVYRPRSKPAGAVLTK